ncbi:MAG: bifunctional 5,10-methylenetetrahydrofolate dehydrogenase/5,10-methenyltetrahydrofolate cyclohydrolase [Candidatus Magasanikbacteria bacterium]|nr:bifunctional 5,10-methylenetetrahydrofolate dehydrogenase/5,10-methenyltetrahydrofolate cyclohydrolase [Candidatus Magasanikbacteria bacterium]
MSGILIDGKAVAEKINLRTIEIVKKLKKKKITPRLEVILVGDDKPSQTYVSKKGDAAKKVGIDFQLHVMPGKTSMKTLITKINKIQSNKKLSGLIVQLPLPEHLYVPEVLNTIRPEIDVDCLTDANIGRLVMKTNFLTPPTPAAAVAILHDLKVEMSGKNITIIGMGALVGKPMAIMMINEGASVTTINSRTKNTKEKCLNADIIVTGVGHKDVLRGDMVKKGAIVIDTGVCFVDGKMYGDVNVAEVAKKAAYVTPTPGGVGPNTVARLLYNTALCAQKKITKK